MQRWITTACYLAALGLGRADAHCNPIVISGGTQLVVSGGVAGAGVASMAFGETYAECVPIPEGAAWVTEIPGVDLSGVPAESGLFLEPLSPLDYSGGSPTARTLWYWDGNAVSQAPTGALLTIFSTQLFGELSLRSDQLIGGPSLKLLDPKTNELGRHVHPMLYALETTVPSGAYGFFARFTSTAAAPSEPVLLTLNLGLDAEGLAQATAAIGAATLAPTPGDYNGDGAVDAADYTTWRDALGGNTNLPNDTTPGSVTAADFDVWKNNFGAGSTGLASLVVPEPRGWILLLMGVLLISSARRPFEKLVPIKS